MDPSEKEKFLSALDEDTRNFYDDILNERASFDGFSAFASMQDHLVNTSFNDLNDAQFSRFTDWAMSESLKSVTPFDHGGYVQGYGFNPSDTMMQDSFSSMNNDMNFPSNDFGGGGGFDNF